MKIAIIGGIGSGKSEVLKVARQLGFACLSADEINAELLSSPEYIEDIGAVFPTVVCDGCIDRRKLAEIVFSDVAEREKLNAIAHPRILTRISESQVNPLIVEMPLLFEIGAQSLFDEIVLVNTPVELRLDRLEKRGLSREDALRRMSAQADASDLKSVATCVIDNCGDLNALKRNTEAVLEKILNKN